MAKKAFPAGFAAHSSPGLDDYLMVSDGTSAKKVLGTTYAALLAASGDIAASNDVASGALANPTAVLVNGAMDTASQIVFIGAGVYAGLPAMTGSGSIFLYALGSCALAPFGYPASTQTINGSLNTLFPLNATGLYILTRDGAGAWNVTSSTGIKNDFSRSNGVPGASDDSTAGYETGSVRITSADAVYRCLTAGAGTATWTLVPTSASVAAALAAAVAAQSAADDAQADATQGINDAAAAQGDATTALATLGVLSGYVTPLISIVDPLSVFPSAGTIGYLAGFTDFLGPGSGTAPYATFGTGTGSYVSWVAAPAGREGILDLGCGTTTTGLATCYLGDTAIPLGNGAWRWRGDVRVPTASDGTDTYAARLGLWDAYQGGDGIDAVGFRYTHSVNSGNWVCVTRSNSVETTTNTSIPAQHASLYRKLEIEIDATGSLVTFYIDGVSLGTHTTNIPTGATRAVGITANILKSAGTNSRSIYLDLMGHRLDRTTEI